MEFGTGYPNYIHRLHVLLTVEGLENLVTFFEIISPQRTCIPFEIKGVSITLACNDQDQNVLKQPVTNQNLPSESTQVRKSVEENDQCKPTDPKSKAKKIKHKKTEDAVSRYKRFQKYRKYRKRKRAEFFEERAKRLQDKKNTNRKARQN